VEAPGCGQLTAAGVDSAASGSSELDTLRAARTQLANDDAVCSVVCGRFGGRGSHSSTFQLNLSRFKHKIHPTHPLKSPDTA